MEVQTLSISNYKTHTGASYDLIELHFHQFGQAIGTAPVVLVNHSLTGDSIVCGDQGWWSEIIGEGQTIDTNRYTVLAFNIPGNGMLEQTFSRPEDFHTGDIAALFLEGLKLLGVTHLFALIGGSIGGGIAWEMAALAPEFAEYLIPIAADWKANDWIIANTFLQKRILENSKNPLEDARIHAMLTYRTPQSFDFRFGRTKNEEQGIYNIESWLLHHGNKLGVLVEVGCETDFVAKTEGFNDLASSIAMQVAASNPLALTSDLIDQSVIDKEQELVTEELKNSGKPEDIAKKISLGKMNKFKEENSLLTQAWVMEPKKKVQDIVKELSIADLKIKEFYRIKIGE